MHLWLSWNYSVDQDGFGLKRFFCFCLLSAEINSLCHQVWLKLAFSFLVTKERGQYNYYVVRTFRRSGNDGVLVGIVLMVIEAQVEEIVTCLDCIHCLDFTESKETLDQGTSTTQFAYLQ